MAGAIESYSKLEAFSEPKLPVKYPRDGGWRPRPEDNPFNGWYWRCNIAGAANGVLKGQRVAVKDVACVAGIPMTIGSSLLDGFVPDVDATIVTRILDAGGTIVGTTNCEAFAFSGAGHTCNHGPVRNRHNPAHNPGGSSSGSAAVLATGHADVAIGGDQGGSIRLPASWSGVLGLKPTFGLVPYTGCAMIEGDARSHRPDGDDGRGHRAAPHRDRGVRPARSAAARRHPARSRHRLRAGAAARREGPQGRAGQGR